MVEKVIIIGSGPAGLTAGIYCARANLEPVIFEGLQPGGQLTITTDVENYPGFPDGVMGPDLMNLFREQATKFGAKTHMLNVEKVDISKKPFEVYVGSDIYKTHSIIISTGASAKLLGLENESKLMGYGVSACATCDAFFYKDKKVLVVGGGDSAMEEALYLTKFASSVTIIHRRDSFRASQIMQDRVLNNSKINIMWNHSVVDMLGDVDNGGLSSVLLKDIKLDKNVEVKCDGIFLAIGHTPNSSLFKDMVKFDENDYIATIPGTTQTSVEGVFASGDIQDSKYRQAITAAGSGCMAAIDCEHYLVSNELIEI